MHAHTHALPMRPMQVQTCKYTVGMISSSESVAAVGWTNDSNPLLFWVQAL